MTIWYDEQYENDVRFGLAVKERLFQDSSKFQKIEILDTHTFGRVLVLDEVFMTSERDEFFYHELLAHPPIISAPKAERVLVIGGGDGGTVREILRHPGVERVVLVEIDAMVVEASKKYLPGIGSAWDDPRLEVRIGDGVAYVRETDDPLYDLIILDGCDPVGPAKGLFNTEFYRNCRRMLTENGVFALQSASPFDQQDLFLQIQQSLGGVFPSVHPYFGVVPIYCAGGWSWTCAGCAADYDPLAIHEERLAAIEPHTRYYNREIHRGAFARPNYIKRMLDAHQE